MKINSSFDIPLFEEIKYLIYFFLRLYYNTPYKI